MDWARVFKDLRVKDNSAKSFAVAVFDQDSWFLRGLRMGQEKAPQAPEVSEERREIIKAIGKFAEDNNLVKKPEPTPKVEAVAESKDETEAPKIELSIEEKKTVTDKRNIIHELQDGHSEWSSYLSRESQGVSYSLDEKEKNSLSKSEDIQTCKVVFVGDTYTEQSEHEDLLGKMIAAMQLNQADTVRFYYDDSFTDTDFVYSLINEIYLSKPDYVVSLGAKVTSLLLQKKDRLSKIHGKFFPSKVVQKNTEQEHEFEVIPVFHPDFLRINPSMKRAAWTDLQKIMQKLSQ